ncbi:MAG: hypothetical protein PHV92_04395 [Candidatus Omnitrophica bacterium]|nr:hypothetical protein [Candidatus Omnitrophota bacterium]
MLNLQFKGQALLEVAIFGSIILMLLGVLINYGLKYNSQQKTMQQAFRKSLARAVSQPGISTSSVVVKDTHIPNPSDTFGVGSVTPFTGSAGAVIRDYQMSETADTESELPRISLNINGQELTYLTAGFRDETNVPEGSLDRYDEIYGSGNVWVTSDGECLEEGTSVDPNTGETATSCIQPTQNIRIIDYCAGEIMDYGSAVKQCRMIVDSEACAIECNRSHYGDSSGTDCSSVCGQTINIPWYCADYTEADSVNHAYNFPLLEQLFASSALKAMGLQQGYTQRTTTENALRKTESPSGITTTDNLNWKTETTRKIITQPYGATSVSPVTEEVTSEVAQEKVDSRKTEW